MATASPARSTRPCMFWRRWSERVRPPTSVERFAHAVDAIVPNVGHGDLEEVQEPGPEDRRHALQAISCLRQVSSRDRGDQPRCTCPELARKPCRWPFH